MDRPSALWRRADEPVVAHGLAVRDLAPGDYARTRGVAQRAARLARGYALARDGRRLLLSAAWLHALAPPPEPPRVLRRAGQERLARIIAHLPALGFAPDAAGEFLPPDPPDRTLARLLGMARLTTGAAGEPVSPAWVLRERAAAGAGAAELRALVAFVADLADDPRARAAVERLAPVGR